MVSVLFNQILIMFALILIGYLLVRKGLLNRQSTKDFPTLLVYGAMPCVILNAYNLEFSAQRFAFLGLAFLLAALVHLVSFVIARLFFKHEDGIMEFSAAFSNAGFIGIPLVQAALGEEAVFYVSSFVAFLMIMQFTYGAYIITKSTKVIALRNMLKMPVLISTFIGILLFVSQIRYPAFLGRTISIIAALNTPLAMINIGIYLSEISLISLFMKGLVYRASLVRLVIIPLALVLVFKPIPESLNLLKMTMLIAASAPSPANVTIIAETYQRDVDDAVRTVSLSTLLSIITLPLIVALAQMFW